MKKVLVLALVAVMVFGLVACGGSGAANLDGTWTVKSINDMSVADYAAETGAEEEALMSTWEISGSKASVEGNGATAEYDLELKANGAEVLMDGEVFMSMTLANDELSYSMAMGDVEVTVVLEKN